jgi:hypothetical protein
MTGGRSSSCDASASPNGQLMRQKVVTSSTPRKYHSRAQLHANLLCTHITINYVQHLRKTIQVWCRYRLIIHHLKCMDSLIECMLVCGHLAFLAPTHHWACWTYSLTSMQGLIWAKPMQIDVMRAYSRYRVASMRENESEVELVHRSRSWNTACVYLHRVSVYKYVIAIRSLSDCSQRLCP